MAEEPFSPQNASKIPNSARHFHKNMHLFMPPNVQDGNLHALTEFPEGFGGLYSGGDNNHIRGSKAPWNTKV